MYAQKGILLTVSAMIGKAVSGSQRRQFVVSIATSQLGTQSQAGEARLRRGSRIAISQNYLGGSLDKLGAKIGDR